MSSRYERITQNSQSVSAVNQSIFYAGIGIVFQVIPMNQEPALNQNAEDENNRQVKSHKGYQSHGYSLEESNFDDENNRQVKSANGYQSHGDEDNINPWETDRFADGYQENVFEINLGDTPYTESAANPNPKLPGYGSGLGYKSKKSQESTSPELEL